MNVHDSRLTDSDRAAMLAARSEFVARVALEHTSRQFVWREQYRETLRRVIVHAIGCTLLDLRDAEVDYVDALVAEVTA